MPLRSLRCLYHAKAAALPAPLDARDNHPEALAYHPIIDDQIKIRTPCRPNGGR